MLFRTEGKVTAYLHQSTAREIQHTGVQYVRLLLFLDTSNYILCTAVKPAILQSSNYRHHVIRHVGKSDYQAFGNTVKYHSVSAGVDGW